MVKYEAILGEGVYLEPDRGFTKKGTISMKKLGKALAVAFVALCAGSLFADAGNICITFSTTPTDRYLDGTAALNGEYYALCWSPNATFGGINADGTAVNSIDKVLLFAPCAEGNPDTHCGDIMFQLDSTEAPSGGYYFVYLVDSRKTSDTLAGDTDNNGKPDLINGISLAAEPVQASAMSKVSLGASKTSLDAFVESAVPEGGESPTITDFVLSGDNALISVTNMHPSVRYNVRTGGTIADLTTTEVVLPVQPKTSASLNAEVTFVVPKKDANFFKVVRQPLSTAAVNN